ncbi:flagellar biosynthetic protein FliR [Pseudogemmobacter sonorensis]|uniref:flagellar biosynthetic protein FliR n=1 Tax=Pseudogemmobacter sonorensis TaxID=2989681 RepID=UPI0036B8B84F
MNGLWAGLAGLVGLAEEAIAHFALVFLRVGAAVALIPAFGEQAVPQRIKLALALATTFVVAPAVAWAPAPGSAAFLAEAVVGVILGIGLRLVLLGLQTAGSIAAQSVSLAQMFNGTGPDPQPIISNVLVLAGLALFVATGGVARAVELLVLSYQLMPAGELPRAAVIAEWGIGRISRAFALAFALAAPFVLAALLYNLALGVINRAMPMLMVTFIGAPALTLGGLVLLALIAPHLLVVWREAMDRALLLPLVP